MAMFNDNALNGAEAKKECVRRLPLPQPPHLNCFINFRDAPHMVDHEDEDCPRFDDLPDMPSPPPSVASSSSGSSRPSSPVNGPSMEQLLRAPRKSLNSSSFNIGAPIAGPKFDDSDDDEEESMFSPFVAGTTQPTIEYLLRAPQRPRKSIGYRGAPVPFTFYSDDEEENSTQGDQVVQETTQEEPVFMHHHGVPKKAKSVSAISTHPFIFYGTNEDSGIECEEVLSFPPLSPVTAFGTPPPLKNLLKAPRRESRRLSISDVTADCVQGGSPVSRGQKRSLEDSDVQTTPKRRRLSDTIGRRLSAI